MEAKMSETRVLRFRCTLKNPMWSNLPEPSTTASLINISWFWDVKPQILLLMFTGLDSRPEGRGIESRPRRQHFDGGEMLKAHVLRFKCTLKIRRWSKFSVASTTAYFIIISWFWDIIPKNYYTNAANIH